MKIQLDVALGHLTSRRRQTLVSLSGVVLGVAFFLAVSSLMRGSEKDFLKRMVDNSPHITVSDEFRHAQPQPGAKPPAKRPNSNSTPICPALRTAKGAGR